MVEVVIVQEQNRHPVYFVGRRGGLLLEHIHV